MPTVNVQIGRRAFDLVCGDGQEDHLQKLAAEVSNRVDELSKTMGSNNDTLLLVMSSLMMQDKINNIEISGDSSSQIEGISPEENEKAVNSAVTDAVNAIAQYVENVADRIQSV